MTTFDKAYANLTKLDNARVRLALLRHDIAEAEEIAANMPLSTEAWQMIDDWRKTWRQE